MRRMGKDEEEKSPNPVDLYVGGRIRMRRRSLGISQERLAADLGLTFQQVQKYERGANRVSASKLYEISRSLKAPLEFFFEGLDDPTGEIIGGSQPDPAVHGFLMTNEGLELAAAFPKIRDAELRKRILEMLHALVRSNDD